MIEVVHNTSDYKNMIKKRVYRYIMFMQLRMATWIRNVMRELAKVPTIQM